MEIDLLLSFDDRSRLREWLRLNHASAPHAWVACSKGGYRGPGAIPYVDVVEECLCFGWIDSTMKSLPDGRCAQRISPRRKGSYWTILNTGRCRDLERRGLMTPAGLEALAAARKKEFVSERDLVRMVRILEEGSIRYWVGGGWGVDILAGRRTRVHRDLDIAYDSSQTGLLLQVLGEGSFVVEDDGLPVRMGLHHQELGYLDIHPLVFSADGRIAHVDARGRSRAFGRGNLSSACFAGRTIPCVSVRGQRMLHRGYEPGEKDLHDLGLLSEL